ncbi:hypothetical protein ACU8V7_05855 [Zobellia nedashkovskayae]
MIHLPCHSKIRLIALCTLTGIVAVSCGSYQSTSYYDNDGIYSSDNQVSVERQARPQQTRQQAQANDEPYSDYFGQQADQYDQALDGEIFTDVDSYSSGTAQDSISGGELTDYYNNDNDYAGYAGWGDNATSVEISVYDNGWNGYGGFAWSSPWLFNSYGWGGYGYGGFYNPWRNRYRPWGWGGFGYGYGYGGYSGFGWGGYGTWCPPYGYYNGYNNYSYRNRSYAYNRTRRGYNTNTNAISGNNSRYTSRIKC